MNVIRDQFNPYLCEGNTLLTGEEQHDDDIKCVF